MCQPPCGSWQKTRRELGEHAYGVLTVAAIPVGLGGVLSRYLGPEMWLMGLGVAGYVTACFAVLILGDLAVQCLLGWWDVEARRRELAERAR